MAMNSRKFALYLVLAVGVATSVYVWTVRNPFASEVDPTARTRTIKYKCAKCGNTFEVALANVASLKNADGRVLCPKCHSADTGKRDVRLKVGFPSPNQPYQDPQPQTETKTPPQANPGLRR